MNKSAANKEKVNWEELLAAGGPTRKAEYSKSTVASLHEKFPTVKEGRLEYLAEAIDRVAALSIRDVLSQKAMDKFGGKELNMLAKPPFEEALTDALISHLSDEIENFVPQIEPEDIAEI